MMGKLIQLCVQWRGLTTLAAIGILLGGWWVVRTIPIDAIPDLSDVQVIVLAEYPGQAPQVIEDQVTYPLVTALLAVPNAKVVRGQSMFGVSFVYVLFDEGTDLNSARCRIGICASSCRVSRVWRRLPASAGTSSNTRYCSIP